MPATEVACGAGHKFAVLLKVYAHCIDRQADTVNKCIADTLGGPDSPPYDGPTKYMFCGQSAHRRASPGRPASGFSYLGAQRGRWCSCQRRSRAKIAARVPSFSA